MSLAMEATAPEPIKVSLPESISKDNGTAPIDQEAPNSIDKSHNPYFPKTSDIHRSESSIASQPSTSTEQALAHAQRQLFVGNLPFRVRWQDLKDLFRKAGPVLRADVAMGYDNRSKGHGTVLFATLDDAKQAIKIFNNYNWQGRILEVREDRGFIDVQNHQNGDMNNAHSIETSGPDGQRRMGPPGQLGPMPPPMFPQMVPQMVGPPVGGPAAYFFQGVGNINGMGTWLNGQPRGLPPAPSFAGRLLFVGNLPFQMQWQDLKDLFRNAGNILRADIAIGPDNRSRGFGTVLFATTEDASNAVKMYDGYDYQGRTLRVHVDKFTSQMQPPRPPPMMGPPYGLPHQGGMSMGHPSHDGSQIPLGSPLHQPPHPGMPTMSFHPFPPTPPLHPAFLSPGLGPFSPPLASPTHIYGNINPFFNLNPAPGAPLHHPMPPQQGQTSQGTGYANSLTGFGGGDPNAVAAAAPSSLDGTGGYPFPSSILGPIIGNTSGSNLKKPSPLSGTVTNASASGSAVIDGGSTVTSPALSSSAVQVDADNSTTPTSSAGIFFTPPPFVAAAAAASAQAPNDLAASLEHLSISEKLQRRESS